MADEVKNYTTGVVEEELYASSSTIPLNTTAPLAVEYGKIRDGYDAVVVGIAATQSVSCSVFLKVNEKQYYSNGLNTAGLPSNLEETELLVHLEPGDTWELGITNTSGGNITINWRFRIRLFRR